MKQFRGKILSFLLAAAMVCTPFTAATPVFAAETDSDIIQVAEKNDIVIEDIVEDAITVEDFDVEAVEEIAVDEDTSEIETLIIEENDVDAAQKEVLSLQEDPVVLEDGLYKATKITTDVTTDASGMIMVTEATVVIKDGEASAIVTMKGTGADRFYVSDTATKDTIIAEAVAEEEKELSGQFGKLLGGYQFEGSPAYSFWPVPIKLGEPIVYAARSASHFSKQDTTPEKYYYVHDFQIDATDLEKITDSTELPVTPQQEAEKYINQYFLDGKISKDHTSSITGKKANITMPYYEGESQIKSFVFKMAESDKFRSGWFVDKSILNTQHFTSSNLKKIRYPEGAKGTVTYTPKATDRDNGLTFTATLKLYSADSYYDQYDGTEQYYYVDSSKSAAAELLAEQTFTITVQDKPIIDFNVTVEVKDTKTGEAIADPVIRVINEADNSEVAAKDGVYVLNSLKKYTIAASKEGYVAEGGAAEVQKTGWAPSKDDTVTLNLLKEEDSKHKVTIHVVDQLGDEVTAPVINMTRDGETVAAEADGSYLLYDNIQYRYSVGGEGYETKDYNYVKVTQDSTEKVIINKYLSEHRVTFDIRDSADSSIYLTDAEKVISVDGKEIPANEDGSYTVPDGADVTITAMKEGYQDRTQTYENVSGFEYETSRYLSLTKTFKVQLGEELEKAIAYAETIVEAETEEGYKYPVGTKAALEEVIAAGQQAFDSETATEEECNEALSNLKSAEKKAENAQYPNKVNVKVRLHRTSNSVPELFDLTVTGADSTNLKYKKPSAVRKDVTVLDVIVAMYTSIYGEEFTKKPTALFEQEDMGIYVVTRMFGEVTNATMYQLNNKHIDHMGYQKTVVNEGDSVTIAVAGGDYLYFENPELATAPDQTVEAKLVLGDMVSSTNPASPASGYIVTLADEDGHEVSAVSGEDGTIKFAFAEYGMYSVKSATKEGKDKILVPYATVNALKPADTTEADKVAETVPEDLSIYTEETAKAVADAQAAVEAAKAARDQEALDKAVQELQTALSALDKKPVDSSAADETVAKVPADLSGYSAESAKAVTDALAAMEAAKEAKDQAAFNEAAKALEAALANLTAKADSTITVKAKSATYNGKAVASNKAVVTGSTGEVTYKYYSDAKCTKEVKAADVKAAKTYYVIATVAADDNYKAATSAPVKLTIKKAKNPMTVKAAKKVQTVKAKKVKSKKQKTKKSAFKFTKKAQGKVTYKIVGGKAKAKKALKVNKKGQIIVKKGTKKGTYKIKVQVKAKGNKNYKSLTKNIWVTVKVK